MTDTPSGGAGGAEDQDQRQPWFPPTDYPGGYGPPPPGTGYGSPPGTGYAPPPGTGYGPSGTGYGPPGSGYGPPGTGYGPPPGAWSPPPQAPKPGVIPLRPIAVGEILDGAFTSIRRNPKATLGIAAIVLTISGIITTGLAIILSRMVGSVNLPTPGQTYTPRQEAHLVTELLAVVLPTAAVSVLLAFVVRLILTGLLTAVIGRSVLGYRITAGQAWHIALPRLPALLGATLLTLLIVIAPWIALAVLLIVLGAIGAPTGVVIALGVLGCLAAVVIDIWFWVMLSMSAPAVVLERQGPARSLSRSWRLVRSSFWRVLGILLLTVLIVAVAGSILQLPFGFVSGLTGGFPEFAQALQPSLAGRIVSAIGSIVAGTVTVPISAGVTVLLYVDLRMRREGLDLVLQTVTGGGQPSGDEFATVWRPTGPGGPGGPGGPAQPGTIGPGPAAGPTPPAAGAPPAW